MNRLSWSIFATVLALLTIQSAVAFEEATEAVEAAAFDGVGVDPDAGLTVIQTVERRGYAVEEHKVTTLDGYILTMYRLPKSYSETQSNSEPAPNKPAVYLIHGLLDSSYTYVLNYRDQSLAYILADEGYDVWLGNNRGTTWSRGHTKYTDDDDEFWDFSWEDMALYDMPSMLQYVLEQTGRETLSYIGHSEGTVQAFAGFSRNQEIAKKVTYFGALAPVAKVGHITSPVFKALAETYLDKLFDLLGVKEFFSHTALIQDLLGKYGCAFVDVACDSVINILTGISDNMNQSRIHVYIGQTPAGTSVKNMGHFAQGIRDNTFRMYDYGCSCFSWLPDSLCLDSLCENKKVYGTAEPPAFDLSNMVYPRVSFFTGSNDWIATAADTDQLRAGLPSGTIVAEQQSDYNHLDFTWAINAKETIYDDLLKEMASYEGIGY